VQLNEVRCAIAAFAVAALPNEVPALFKLFHGPLHRADGQLGIVGNALLAGEANSFIVDNGTKRHEHGFRRRRPRLEALCPCQKLEAHPLPSRMAITRSMVGW
jgi:hypothetical protein